MQTLYPLSNVVTKTRTRGRHVSLYHVSYNALVVVVVVVFVVVVVTN